MRLLLNVLVKSSLILFFTALTIVAVAYVRQDHAYFHPTPAVELPQELSSKGFEEITLTTSDNIKLGAWYHKSTKSNKAIVLFHGNADHLTMFQDFFTRLADAGYTVLGVNYRGYGKSEGRPSEKGLYLDGHAAIDFLKKDTDTKNIIVVGRSIGTGVASQMAMDYELGGVALISPYTSFKKIGEEVYWYLPVKYIAKYNFDSYKKYENNKAPVLIMHGDLDGLIPYSHAEELYAIIRSPKELVKYEGVGHVDFDMIRLADDIIRFFTLHNMGPDQ